ncbi:MAG: hypothetical protein ABIR91_05545 [Candidatus Saccharimonadales bacterium]
MNRVLIIVAGFAASMVGVFGVVQVVKAADRPPLTSSHIERIKDNCIDAQTSLIQLHASDGLLRVNRGQVYESISTRLMAPLNSRLVLNRVDTANLQPIAIKYEQQLATFRATYRDYEVAMSKALADNCIRNPTNFYYDLGDARTKRQNTHKTVKALQKTIRDYGTEFDSFAQSYMEKLP